MSVNWPYTDSGTFVESADGQHLALNPIFEAHIRQIDNWSMNPAVIATYPFLRPFCRPERSRRGEITDA
jgi:hypothetical protein